MRTSQALMLPMLAFQISLNSASWNRPTSQYICFKCYLGLNINRITVVTLEQTYNSPAKHLYNNRLLDINLLLCLEFKWRSRFSTFWSPITELCTFVSNGYMKKEKTFLYVPSLSYHHALIFHIFVRFQDFVSFLLFACIITTLHKCTTFTFYFLLLLPPRPWG